MQVKTISLNVDIGVCLLTSHRWYLARTSVRTPLRRAAARGGRASESARTDQSS